MSQVVVMSVTQQQIFPVNMIVAVLKQNGVEAIADIRDENIHTKMVEHSDDCIPYLVVIGEAEVEVQKGLVRTCNGEDLGWMTFEQFMELIEK